jgi:diguanylate cyclase
MNEEQSTERSAELLRLTLPLLAKHGSGCHPVSYALWYEYAAAENAKLREAVDEALADEPRLSAATTQELYLRFVVDRAEHAVARAQSGLLELMTRMQQSVDQADARATGFNEHLSSFGEQVAGGSLGAPAVAAMLAQVRQLGDSLGGLKGQLSNGRDEVRRLSDELTRMRDEVLTDPLTELMNRRGLERALAQAFDGADHAPLCLVMLDIDHFKRVNDTYGHVFGDRVIQGVAAAIRAAVAERERSARYGGEEFAVLLHGVDARAGTEVAERIRQLVERSRIRKTNGEAIGNLTVSAGVACRRPDDRIETLIERADRALYASKAGGRNRVSVEH